MTDRVARPARRKPPTSNPKSRRAPGGATGDYRRRVAKRLTSGFRGRVLRAAGRRIAAFDISSLETLHSRKFDRSGPFCADANLAPSEAPPPCVVATLPHARLPANTSLDETKGKFASLQSIEKSQNVEIIAQSGGIHIVCERCPKASTLAAPSEAPPPCVVAPLPHARLPGEFVTEETDGKFSSLQSIEKSQNEKIRVVARGLRLAEDQLRDQCAPRVRPWTK
jgi:hypothetical protein